MHEAIQSKNKHKHTRQFNGMASSPRADHHIVRARAFRGVHPANPGFLFRLATFRRQSCITRQMWRTRVDFNEP